MLLSNHHHHNDLKNMQYFGKTHSPFRYPGGKFYARKLILQHIPHSCVYCEPFAGGASIFFAKSPADVSILNDLDTGVANTLIQIRDNLNGLLDLLDGVPATKEIHWFIKNKYHPRTKLEQAFKWFYLNRTSYSGIMKPENCYWGFGEKYSMGPKNWPTHLSAVSARLQGVEIKSEDFESVIDALPTGAFMFVDPPYYNADQKKFYSCNFAMNDHERLSNCLRRNADRLLFMITYDNSPKVWELYKWCDVLEEHEWQYTINRTDDQKNGRKLVDGYKSKRQNGRELFIKNYDISAMPLFGDMPMVAAQ